MSLPRQNRLSSSRDFSRVHRRGTRAATQHLAVRALKLPPFKIAKTKIAKTKIAKTKIAKTKIAKTKIAKTKSAKVRSVDATPSTLSSSFGISISRKVSKRAVVRNRIKRQLKAVLRRNLAGIVPGWQVVIVVRPVAIECEFDDFLRELEGLLKKLKILN